MIKSGTYWDLLLLLLMIAAVYYYMDKALKGQELPQIRAIPAVDAIYEGVGRSIEMEKPVHFSMGASGGALHTSLVSMTLAALMILRHTVKLCARLGSRLIIHIPGQTEAIPLVEGIARDAYLEEGKPEMLRREDLRYHGYSSTSFTQAVAGSFARDGVGLNVMVGIWYTDCVMPLESSKIYGGLNVGGTARWIMAYAFAMMTDYLLLGEELYAAGAAVSDNPVMVSGIASEEIGKYFSLVVLVVGLILMALGVDVASILAM
ncbi:MAG: hypothetical protein NWE79_04675 [Candidatus Bathyarchaeota archaeon]|jgi:hypothetical protein|nr:hypothetical protein [Candidatus Bathyarchaeota archaeon]